MASQIQKIQQAIEPYRQEIIHHKVYGAIQTLEDLQIFMQSHVFAVWDFMSLLKALQNQLTCTSVPWFPSGDPDTRFLINEIVNGEESDIDGSGNRKSHYEMYLDAMVQCGADVEPIENFLYTLQRSSDFELAGQASKAPQKALDFVNYTFDIIQRDKDYLNAAVFTFGREDLIPGMFLSIVKDIHAKFPEQVSIFKYYLERHIEVDGDHHSHLALQMTENLCGEDEQKWAEVEIAVINSLKKRIELWDGVYEQLIHSEFSVAD